MRRARRKIANRVAPGYMADRARRHGRRLRERNGVTDITRRLVDDAAPVVRSGPFAGMRYPSGSASEVDLLASKVLGVYEQEIAPDFSPGVLTFVDVGCAEGYYAVGMAVANPRLTTYAFDIAPSARRLCRRIAALNGVGDRVNVERRFSLDGIDMDGALMLCDIEGAEGELFDPSLVAQLRRARVVIEVHGDSGLSERLRELFGQTHACRRVEPQPRGNGSLPETGVPAKELSAVLSERRLRGGTHWLVFEPLG